MRGRGRPIVPQQGFHCIVDLEDVAFERCIECAATQGRCQLTASLLRGMAEQARTRNAEDAARVDAVRADIDNDGRRLLPLPMVGDRAADLADDEGDLDPAMTGRPIPALSVTALTGCVRQAYLKATEP